MNVCGAVLPEGSKEPIVRPIVMFASVRRSQAMNVTPENDGECRREAVSADEELRQRVCRYLHHSGHAPVRSIDVRARGDTITLCGIVPTYYVRQLAIACAQRVAGVRHVIDELQTEMPPRIRRPR